MSSLVSLSGFARIWSVRLFAGLLLIFVLTAIEPLSIFGIKFSYIWKMVAILIVGLLLLLQIVATGGRVCVGRPVRRTLMIWWLYCCAPLPGLLLGADVLEGIVAVGQRALPLMIVLLILANGGLSRVQLERIVLASSIAAIVAASPYLLGVLEPLGSAYDLDAVFGEHARGFVGPFQTPHAAGLTYALLAVAMIWVSLLEQGINRLLSIGISVILIALMFATFARAGLLAFMAGVSLLVVRPGGVRGVAYAVALMASVVAALVLSADYWIDSSIGRRLAGLTVFSENVNVDVISSGRVRLWLAATQGFLSFDGLEKLVGVGLAGSLAVMRNVFGVALIPHSVIFNELLAYGLLGLLAALGLMISLAAGASSERGRLGRPLGAAIAAFAVVQGLDYPMQLLIVALPICLTRCNVGEAHATSGASAYS